MLEDKNAVNQQGFIKNLADFMVNFLLGLLPHLPLFNDLKSILMRSRGAIVGKRVKLLSNLWIDCFNTVKIGDDVSLALGITIVAAGGLTIGDRSMVGYGSTILTSSHRIPEDRKEIRFSGAELKKVIIENDVWVGAGTIILPGVTIGEGSVIGAGTVVTEDIPPFSVAVGIPAKIIKNR